MISDRARHLLLACLRNDETGADAFRAWKSEAERTDIEGHELRLMPMLHANLKRLAVGDPMLDRLGGMAKHVWLSGEMRIREILAALTVLDTVEIPFVALKGVAIRARWPDTARARPMGDADVLVPLTQARAALARLEAAGWIPDSPLALLASGDLERSHALGLLYRVRSRHATYLDLHWRPAEAIHDPAHAIGVMERSEIGRIDGRSVPIASLADHLFILLAHAWLERDMPRRDWVAEAALLLREAAAEVDWDVLARLVNRYRLSEWAPAALGLVAEIGNLALPYAAIHAFDHRSVLVEVHAATDDVEGTWYRDLAVERLALLADCIDTSLTPLDDSPLGGWALPNETGRWTLGPAAHLALRLPDEAVSAPIPLRLHLVPYLPAFSPRLRLSVWAGGEESSWDLNGEATERVLTLDGLAVAVGDRTVLPIRFRIERPEPLSALRTAEDDPRDLGVYLRRIERAAAESLPAPRLSLRLDTKEAERACWSGWGHAEPPGRWTIGEEARLLLARPRGAGSLRLAIHWVVAPEGTGGQILDVTLGNQVVLTARLPAGASTDWLTIPVGGEGRVGELLDLRLRPRMPSPPAGGGDKRLLGVMIRDVVWVGV